MWFVIDPECEMNFIAAMIAIMAATLAAPSAHASSFAEFNGAVENAAVHYRVALHNLRTGNTERAASTAEAFAALLRRCDDVASARPRSDPEFGPCNRRLHHNSWFNGRGG